MPFISQVAMRKKIKNFWRRLYFHDGTGKRITYTLMILPWDIYLIILYSKTEYPLPFLKLNLGTGSSTSVLELVRAFEKACLEKLTMKSLKRFDIEESVADPSLAKKLLIGSEI